MISYEAIKISKLSLSGSMFLSSVNLETAELLDLIQRAMIYFRKFDCEYPIFLRFYSLYNFYYKFRLNKTVFDAGVRKAEG